MAKTRVTLSVAPTGTLICDFCSDPRIVKDYNCSDFIVEDTGLGSAGKWAACARCAEMIDRGDKEALTQRALECIFLKHPEWPQEGYVIEGTLKFLQDLHAEFWRLKKP
jgi:hypothetical protein